MHVSALAARKDGSQKQSERTRTRIPQIAIVGAGFVGSTTAYALLHSGMAAEIVLIDRDRRRAEGHVQDLRDAEVFSNATHVFAASSATAALVARQNPRCSSKAILKRVFQHGADADSERGFLIAG